LHSLYLPLLLYIYLPFAVMLDHQRIFVVSHLGLGKRTTFRARFPLYRCSLLRCRLCT
jgi:hypothetical protein